MNEKLSSAQKRLNEVKQLRDKANMLASMHSYLSDRYRRMHSALSSAVLAISTLLIALTFSNDFITSSTGLDPSTLTWIKGTVSVLNFSVVLLLSQWDLQERAAQHRQATRFYFAILNKIRQWVDSQVEITTEMVEEIRLEYGKTESIPKVPNSDFLRLKQQHLQMVATSRELQNAPFDSIRTIQGRLRSQHQDSEADDAGKEAA
jgi:hypothetical protein